MINHEPTLLGTRLAQEQDLDDHVYQAIDIHELAMAYQHDLCCRHDAWQQLLQAYPTAAAKYHTSLQWHDNLEQTHAAILAVCLAMNPSMCIESRDHELHAVIFPLQGNRPCAIKIRRRRDVVACMPGWYHHDFEKFMIRDLVDWKILMYQGLA